MRIGIFCPTLSLCGGGEFVAFAMTNALAQRHYDVHLFTNEEISQVKMKKFFGKRIHPSVKIIVKPTSIPPKSLLSFYQSIFRSYDFMRKCDIWIDAYTNCVFPWTNICYIHYPFFNHYIFDQRFPYFTKFQLMGVPTAPYVFFEKKLVSSKWKLLLANSHYTTKEIRSFSRKKAVVLYPPVSSTNFAKSPENLIQSRREDVVVTVSRFEPNKGLEKIPIIASLTEKYVKFFIIGRVHHAFVLQKLQRTAKRLGLEKRVKFYPNLSKTDLGAMLLKAKIYLHTKIGEHFGISIVEAMALGCIPIVHNSGGPREFVPEEYLYENNYNAAEKIDSCLNKWSPSRALEMRKIAERFREEHFSDDFIKIFENYKQNKKHA